jgi:hypothetical protein
VCVGVCSEQSPQDRDPRVDLVLQSSAEREGWGLLLMSHTPLALNDSDSITEWLRSLSHDRRAERTVSHYTGQYNAAPCAAQCGCWPCRSTIMSGLLRHAGCSLFTHGKLHLTISRSFAPNLKQNFANLPWGVVTKGCVSVYIQ